MPSLRKIIRRIKSVENTKQITAAMKMVAAAKLQKAQKMIYSTRNYADTLEDVLSQVVSRRSIISHPLLRENKTNKKLLVAIAADRGLCGGFNTNLNKTALKILTEKKEDEEYDLIVVGRKVRDFFRTRKIEYKKEYIGFFDRMTISHAEHITNDLIDLYLTGEYKEIILLYNKFKSMLVQEITQDIFLPIKKIELKETDNKVDFTYEGDEDEIIKMLLTETLKLKIWKVLLESYSSEQAARRTAMESATDNAEEMIKKLTITKNKIRQAIITTEITEIVGGAEALKG